MFFTDTELEMTRALVQCRFLPGSREKKFASNLCEFTGPVTERQRWYVYYFIYRFRRQISRISPGLISIAQAYLVINPESPPKKDGARDKLKPVKIKVAKVKWSDPAQLKLF
jgi:hypothetical protein